MQLVPEAADGGAPAARRPVWRWLAPESPVPVVAGVAVVIAGLGLIAYTWGRVAGLLLVPLQLPYILSGGVTGLALVLVGMTIVNVAVRRQDGARRDERAEQLAAVMRSLAEALGSAQEGEA